MWWVLTYSLSYFLRMASALWVVRCEVHGAWCIEEVQNLEIEIRRDRRVLASWVSTRSSSLFPSPKILVEVPRGSGLQGVAFFSPSSLRK